MYRNPWISNYLTHVKFCSQGLGSETPAKASNPRFLQKRALSFQKEFSYEEKDDPAKITKDISLTASLPKVSELRKRFEAITTSASDWEMNRKERLARRLDGIDGEVHPSLLPNLVANQVVCLLPEDTPRYTRASDLCEPHAVQRYGLEGFENPDAPVKPPDRESRGRYSSDTQSSIHTEPVHSSGSTTAAPEQESKAERIARYKAERRRQLAERYGISLDQDLDLDYASHYTRTWNETDHLEKRKRELEELLKGEGRDITLSVYSSTAVSSPKSGNSATPHSRPDPVYDMARTRLDSFSERERLMNLENQRRAAPSESTSTSSYMDVTSSFTAKVPAKDSVALLPPNSPKMSRHSSLASPKHAASPGEMFIGQQAQSILSRQGDIEGQRKHGGYQAPWRGVRERGHQPLHYICPGESRKTSERFRTQPITSAERQETNRSCVSSHVASTDADEEKLDERAKLSVAAKRSLFRELEKSIDGGVPKPRSRNAAVDRRLRRTQDRSRTQPVTTEEVVIAATVPSYELQMPDQSTVTHADSHTLVCSNALPSYSLQASLQQSSAARQQAQGSQEARGSKQASTTEGKVEMQSENLEEPDVCTLSLAEKMELFNRLAQPPTRVTRTRGDTRQRRANARYQTQPVTLGDMEQ
ncbi:hypothetical protein XENORESO_010915, partial [Xenotaenia resolanae]